MGFGDIDGDRMLPREVVGHLLLVWAVEYIERAPSQYAATGFSDAIAVDVVDLDQPGEDGQPGLVARNTWWRPGKLIGTLKRRVGNPEPVLAYMTQGAAAPGRSAPFELLAAHRDPQCRARGEAWLAAHQDFTPSRNYQPEPEPGPLYVQPPTDGPIGQPPPPVTTLHLPPPPTTEESLLARMARQAVAGAARIPTAPEEDKPPF